MIKIEHERNHSKLKAIKSLNDHLDYLQDTTHEDHKDMILQPGRNYFCAGDSRDDFVVAVVESQSRYLTVREGLSGKRSSDLWAEIIQNSGKACHHTPEEQEHIEREILARIAPDTPARCYWHIDPENGYNDLHIIIAAKNLEGTMALQRTDTHMLKRLKILDAEFAEYLNGRARTGRKPGIKPAHVVGTEKARARSKAAKKGKPQPLAKQIAKIAGETEVTADNLPGMLERLGIAILEITKGTIQVLYSSRLKRKGKKVARTGVLIVRELLLQIKGAQLELLRALRKDKPNDIN